MCSSDYDVAGDLLREEQHREGSEFSKLIQDCIKNGTIVPMEVTIKLLENAMTAALKTKAGAGPGWSEGRGRFLIDGFPRKMDQALKFDETVKQASAVLFFSTTEEVMLARLLERGKTSGREDDNVESITKRFKTYLETTMPVIDYYRTLGKVAEVGLLLYNLSGGWVETNQRHGSQVDSSASVEVVHSKASQVVNTIFSSGMTSNIKLD